MKKCPTPKPIGTIRGEPPIPPPPKTAPPPKDF
jgi:hypothetical protein